MVAPTPLFYKNGVLRAKIEAVRGVEQAPAAGDSMLVENVRIGIDPAMIETDEWTGSLDPEAPIPGGMKVPLSFDTYLKASGTRGTAPEIGPLFQICGWAETVIAPVTTTAFGTLGHTSTAVTLAGVTTATQFYRGVPLLLSGPNVDTTLALIADYTGGVATLDRSIGLADPADSFAIPGCVRYAPTSDRSLHKTATFYLFTDGIRWKFTGAAADFSIAMQAGQAGRISWNVMAQYAGRADVAVPTDSVFDTTRPPIWNNPDGYSGAALLDRTQIAARQMAFRPQGQLAQPDNPNSPEGFDPGVVTARNLRCSIDPLMQLVAVRDTIAGLRASSRYILSANYGLTDGNRVALVAPAAQPVAVQPDQRDRMWIEQNDYFCSGRDAGMFILFH
jgi:hypothetical protein